MRGNGHGLPVVWPRWYVRPRLRGLRLRPQRYRVPRLHQRLLAPLRSTRLQQHPGRMPVGDLHAGPPRDLRIHQPGRRDRLLRGRPCSSRDVPGWRLRLRSRLRGKGVRPGWLRRRLWDLRWRHRLPDVNRPVRDGLHPGLHRPAVRRRWLRGLVRNLLGQRVSRLLGGILRQRVQRCGDLRRRQRLHAELPRLPAPLGLRRLRRHLPRQLLEPVGL